MTLRTFFLPVFLLVFALNVYLKVHSDFGIDVERYDVVLQEGVSEWSGYYLKEFISWWLFDLISDARGFLNLSQQLLLLDFGLFMTLVWICKNDEKAESLWFLLFYPSFAFTLLSFNVLRQYVSFVFLAGALVSVLRGRDAVAVAFSILAVFSHNGAILVLLALGLYRMRDFSLTAKVLAFSAGLFALAAISTSDLLTRFFGAGETILEEESWKVALYGLLSCGLGFLVSMKFSTRNVADVNSISAQKRIVTLNWYLVGLGLTLSVLPMQNWMISRNWLTVISLQSFIFLCMKAEASEQRGMWFRFALMAAFVIPMWALTFLLPGASQMAFGST